MKNIKSPDDLFLNYVHPKDVAERVYFRKRHWHHGPPSVDVEGEEGSFGKLKMYFGDEIVEWSIYVRNKEKIVNAAVLAITNFPKYVEEAFGV